MRDSSRLPHAVDLETSGVVVLAQMLQLLGPVLVPRGVAFAVCMAADVPLKAAEARACRFLLHSSTPRMCDASISFSIIGFKSELGRYRSAFLTSSSCGSFPVISLISSRVLGAIR